MKTDATKEREREREGPFERKQAASSSLPRCQGVLSLARTHTETADETSARDRFGVAACWQYQLGPRRTLDGYRSTDPTDPTGRSVGLALFFVPVAASLFGPQWPVRANRSPKVHGIDGRTDGRTGGYPANGCEPFPLSFYPTLPYSAARRVRCPGHSKTRPAAAAKAQRQAARNVWCVSISFHSGRERFLLLNPHSLRAFFPLFRLCLDHPAGNGMTTNPNRFDNFPSHSGPFRLVLGERILFAPCLPLSSLQKEGGPLTKPSKTRPAVSGGSG